MRLYELDKKVKGKRRPSDKDVTGYEEIPFKKKEPDIIDKVVVTLSGKRSAFFTRLANRFDQAAKLKKELAAEEKAVKAETRAAVDEIFDAGDEVYARVVETASLVFRIARREERISEKFDEKAYLLELEKLTGLAVDKLEEIKNKHIKKVTTQVEPKVLAPKQKKVESVNEGALDNIRNYASRVKQYISNFLGKWDNRFASLKAQVEANL